MINENSWRAMSVSERRYELIVYRPTSRRSRSSPAALPTAPLIAGRSPTSTTSSTAGSSRRSRWAVPSPSPRAGGWSTR